MLRLIRSHYVSRHMPTDADHPDREIVFQQLQEAAYKLASKHCLDYRQADFARVAVRQIRIINLGKFNLRQMDHYRHQKYSLLTVMSARKRLIFPIDVLYGIGIDCNGNLYHKVNRRDWKYEEDVHFWTPLNTPADAPHMTDVLSGSVMQSFSSLIYR